MEFKYYLIFAVILFVTSGCGGSGGGSSEPADTRIRILTESDVEITYANGSWLSSVCTEDAPNSQFYTTTFSFDSGNYTATLDFYEDEDCTLSKATNFISSGTYSLGLEVTTTSGVKAYQINLIRDSDGALQETIIQNTGVTLYFDNGDNGGARSDELNFDNEYSLL